MPGPFPGMDPYLESPAHWPGVHAAFIVALTARLNTLLPPAFAANIDERLYIIEPGRAIYPDVAVLQRPGPLLGGGGVAVLEDPPGILTLYPEETRETFVEIRPVDASDHIVTLIEVLSPANKTAGSEGSRAYREKQRDVLRSDAHLIEIDLLRSGQHSVAAPAERLREAGAWDYLICLHRAGQGQRYEFWLKRVRERLPRIRIPLTEGYPDLIVDLQSAFDRVYDEGPYRRRVDYSAPPVPPLAGEDAAWSDALLRERGLRP